MQPDSKGLEILPCVRSEDQSASGRSRSTESLVAERYPSLSVDWAGPSPSASGEGTVIGEIPAEEFATVDSFISDLSADGYGPRY